MKLQTRFSLFIITMLIVLAGTIINVGYFTINKIVYKLYTQQFNRELAHVMMKIENTYQVLEEAGILELEAYVASSQNKLFDQLSRYRFGETGHLYIVNQDNEVILQPKNPLVSVFPSEFTAKMLQSKQGNIRYKMNGNYFFSTFKTTKKWEWLVVFAISEDEIFKYRSNYLKITLLIGVLALLLVSFIAIWLSEKFSYDIKKTLTHITLFENGYLDHQILQPSSTEIGSIQKSLNVMSHKMHIEIERRKVVEEMLVQSKLIAEEANQAKTLFLSNMSHELRTPLNAIIGYSDMVIESLDDHVDPHDVYEDVASINKAGKHLLLLINTILDVAKIESGRFELYYEVFDVYELVVNVSKIITPVIEKKENYLSIECSPNIGSFSLDVIKVQQILLNLLGNAAKFSENSEIKLSVHRKQVTTSECLELVIRDHGIGITAEQLNKIFEPFQQADRSTTRAYGGTGLGLTIVKYFVEMMDGSIDVVSEVGKGCTFTICLPNHKPS